MTYFGLKYGQDLQNRAAHPHQEFTGVPHGRVISNLKPCCDQHIYAVPFCCDNEYEVILKLFTVSTVVEFKPLLPYNTCDALPGEGRKCVRIKL